MELTVSAPGKIFVSGEYAVSRGGDAVIAAMGRRLRCRVRSCRGPGRLRLRSAGVEHEGPIARREIDTPRELRFVAAAALLAARVFAVDGVDLEIETESDLDAGAVKLGLGGSAAAAAATVGAIAALAGESLEPAGLPGSAAAASRPGPHAGIVRCLAVGIAAHRLAQGGGSGADVVASMIGGLVWTRGLDSRHTPRDVAQGAAWAVGSTTVELARLALPQGLALEVVATRRQARSGPRVSRFGARIDAGRRSVGAAALTAWTSGMSHAARQLRSACEAGDGDEVMQAIELAGHLLGRLAPLVGFPVLTRELRSAAAAGVGLRAVVKPSGAGGGDCAVAVVADGDRERLRAAWRSRGLEPLDVPIAVDGLRRERTSAPEGVGNG